MHYVHKTLQSSHDNNKHKFQNYRFFLNWDLDQDDTWNESFLSGIYKVSFSFQLK